MAAADIITPEILRQMLDYDPATGELVWRPRSPASFNTDRRLSKDALCRRWNTRYAGKVAGCGRVGGYRSITVFDIHLTAHRVCWAIHHGRFPSDCIDHINGDRADNRIVNLRDVSVAQNARNMKRDTRNRSGVTGVMWDSERQLWRSYILSNKRHIALGRYADFGEAVHARKIAEKALGFDRNHGKR